MCIEIINKYPKEIQDKIYIITYKDVTNSFNYHENTEIIYNEFKNNITFRNYLFNYMKTNIDIVNNLDDDKLEYITSYLIEELSVFLNGFKYKKIHFNLLPYPAVGIFDLTYKLKNKQIFSKLANKLYLDTKTAYLEAYV
jgi:DNA-dependent RNA polymerase auxiliary subunit epsilon